MDVVSDLNHIQTFKLQWRNKGEVFNADEDTGFADDFLNMMGGGGLFKGPQPASLNFTGEMAEAFKVLTTAMTKKGNQPLLEYGKSKQTYSEGADELKSALDFEATEFNTNLAKQVNNDLTATAAPDTPSDLTEPMKGVVDIASKYLAQNAEFNKDKGKAFKQLLKKMKEKPLEPLFTKGQVQRNMAQAAKELEKAKGLESHYDEPKLAQEIHGKLGKLVEAATPPDLKDDMKETLDQGSKYLSQKAIDEIERGSAFDLLVKELEKKGGEPFSPEHSPLATKSAAAYTLKSAPGLSTVVPDSATAPHFESALHKAVDAAAPKNMAADMSDTIKRGANYLSAFARDREKATSGLLQMMRKNPTKEVAKRDNYSMSYGEGATEIETAPTLTPFLPIKDIADEAKQKLTADMEPVTPSELKIATKSAIVDASRHLSQGVALRSGAAGERYPQDFLSSIMKSSGSRPLFKHKGYSMSHSDAANVLKYAGPLEHDPNAAHLEKQIADEMNTGMSSKLTPTVKSEIAGVMGDAAKHLAKMGMEKGNALQHLTKAMHQKGEVPLGVLQGYKQTYSDGAKRLENAPSLSTDKVDKGSYEGVRAKLTSLYSKNPSEELTPHMPGIIDDASKFLSGPMPETEAEKRQVLSDLMARKGDETFDKNGPGMTYTEASKEITNAPVGATTTNSDKMQQNVEKINAVVPDKKMQIQFKESIFDGAAHLADFVDGRGGSRRETEEDRMTRQEAERRKKLGLPPETEEERLTRQEAERRKKLGLSPETEEERLTRQEAERRKKLGLSPETEEERLTRQEAERRKKLGLSPETDEERLTRQEAERRKKLGLPPETEEERLTRQEAERRKILGLTPETEEERLTRQEAERRKKLGLPPETEKERMARQEAERRRKADLAPETEEERMAKQEAERRKKARLTRGRAGDVRIESDHEREAALGVLHKQLKNKGDETFYKQPQTELTHVQASDWLANKLPKKVDKTVKKSGDTDRLSNKFERKLSNLVSKKITDDMYDSMQDVLIESARNLAEGFVSENYKALVKDGLIAEMQKRENEILIEIDGVPETYFFAAQRLKKAKTFDTDEPCDQVAYYLTKNLDDMIRRRTMARKLSGTMKEHVKDAANYLSALVTKPEPDIEAYVALLGEMEATGDALLIEGNIPKSYKDSAAYLRQLTSFEDQINQPNSSVQSSTEQKLNNLMANVSPRGYQKSHMSSAARSSAKLLVSYMMLQGEKTKALKFLIEWMEAAGEDGGVLLRHGAIRKSYAQGAELLKGNNAEQLSVPSADPVVARKIQIKLVNCMRRTSIPDDYKPLIDDVIEDATMYLAVQLLQPRVIQVCKCMKNVCVQCELWCDEMLRRVARPCCSCARHASVQALADLVPPGQTLQGNSGSSHAFTPGIEMSLTQCPVSSPCPAKKPTAGCEYSATTQYLLYSTTYNQQKDTSLRPNNSFSDLISEEPTSSKSTDLTRSLFSSLNLNEDNIPSIHRGEEQEAALTLSPSYHTAASTSDYSEAKSVPFWQSPMNMYAMTPSQDTNSMFHLMKTLKTDRSRTPIIATDQMSDWTSMMVSLMWNVQAWRDWIQEKFDRTLSYLPEPTLPASETEDSWVNFQRTVATEALQWHQYNNFSRQLTLRLALRYRDKQIVSPTRATNKTRTYMECQQEMLDIIEMFNRWTQWLRAVVEETGSLSKTSETTEPTHEIRWKYFKMKVNDYYEDWKKYNNYLKVYWEHKHRTLISDWLPSWKQPGPVWVVSACGAVPSGAVSAGVYEDELVWVARTTHRRNVLPAALHPSKHSCVLYADGATHHCTKYQVMCNAEAQWTAWRAGALGAQAVRVAPGTYVGRVLYRKSHLIGPVHAPHYRCHVVLFGRPFAFNCYELLVLGGQEA